MPPITPKRLPPTPLAKPQYLAYAFKRTAYACWAEYTMTEHLTPTQLRANLYRILDHAIETGQSVEVERKGRRVRIVAETGGKLDLLKPHADYLKGSPDDIVHMDWSVEWRP